MSYFTFYGGIFLQEHKKETKDSNIIEVLPGKELVFPLSQHQGTPAEPVVVPGDRVYGGQLIAEAGRGISAPVHSSVSGVVKAIEERLTVKGAMETCIVIENDERYKTVDYGDFVEADDLTNEEIIRKIREAGVVGMGGAGYPTAEKLMVKEPEKIRYVIANCAECEPYLTSGYRGIVESPEWIVEGLRIVLKLFPKAKGMFAIEDHKQEAITGLQMVAADTRNMKIVPVKSKYPQGAERMLIYACTGRKLNSGQIPEDIGCIVLNSDTIHAICNAVTFGKPLVKRLITVAGDCIEKPMNLQVYMGSSFQDLVKATGELVKDPKAVICGGPMTGKLLKQMDVPVEKTSSALLCFSEYPAGYSKPEECIHCGRCVEVCNEQLLPSMLVRMAAGGKKDKFLEYGGMECCECGSCSYICPSKRPLTEIIKNMKHQISEGTV
ncbi:MAG: electron transport complex subunit RsxC [Lachnospiraceae bacterium]